MEAIQRITFRTCVFELFDDHVRITFSDGLVSTAYWDFEDDGSHLKASNFAGYGNDRRRMVIEHELAHALIADELGQPYSYSVYSSAKGTGKPGTPWSQRVADEEHLVVRLQRYVNTGSLDEYGNLEAAFGSRLPFVAYQLVYMARPWLFRLRDI